MISPTDAVVYDPPIYIDKIFVLKQPHLYGANMISPLLKTNTFGGEVQRFVVLVLADVSVSPHVPANLFVLGPNNPLARINPT